MVISKEALFLMTLISCEGCIRSQVAPDREAEIRKQIEATFSVEGADVEAIEKLERFPDAGEVLVRMINAEEEPVPHYVMLLGLIKAKASTEILGEKLRHPNPGVRIAASHSLALLGHTAAADKISLLLKDKGLMDHQKVVISEALGNLGKASTLEALKTYLTELTARGETVGNAYEYTAQAILKLDIVGTKDPVLREKRLRDIVAKRPENSEEVRLRIWAVEKLVRYKYLDSIPLLRSILSSETGERVLMESEQVALLTAISQLGGALSDGESKVLREAGVLER